MDYKEKYEQALERAKKLQKTCDSQAVVGWCEHIFPELKESEDEKIRKDIVFYIAANHKDDGEKARWLYWLEKQKTSEEAIQYLKENHSPAEISDFQAAMNIAVAKAYDKGMKDGLEKQGQEPKKVSIWKHWKNGIAGNGEGEQIYLIKYGNTYSLSSCLSFECDYIELSELDKLLSKKQGEQKSDKIEPKFHGGEWIVWNDKFYKVNYNGCGYELIGQDGLRTSLEYGAVDKDAHIFGVADAKEGDVLISQYGKPFIYNGNHDSFHIGSYCGISVESRFKVATEKCHWTENVNIQPATQEQRDLLFSKMHESEYEWDEIKKELKKIEQKFNIGDEIKTANEEPLTITKIDEKGYWSEDLFICGFDDAAKWELVGQKLAWSEEDEKILRNLIDYFEIIDAQLQYPDEQVVDWLKSIKQRIGG